jgi:hypothetical protein
MKYKQSVTLLAPSLCYCSCRFSWNVRNILLWSAPLIRFRVSYAALCLNRLPFLRLRLLIYRGNLIFYYFISLTVSSASPAKLRQINDNET